MAFSTASPDQRQSGRGRRVVVWLLGIVVSAVLLVVLYRAVDVRLVGSTLRQAHPGWLLLSVGFTAPLTALRALRFMWIVPSDARPGFGDAVRMTLVAGTFNMFMPAKTGDLVKSVAIAKHPDATASLAVATVVYERLADLFALLLCGVAGILTSQLVLTLPPWSWLLVALACAASGAMIVSETPMTMLLGVVSRIRNQGRTPRLVAAVVARTHGWPRLHAGLRGRRGWLMLLSVALWFLQLWQIWLFAVAVHIVVPFAACVSLAAASLFIGQLPLTFGGLGARDIALVVLFADYASPEAAAAMGVLSLTRGVLPALAGLLVIRPHLAAVADAVRGWQRP